MWAFKIRKDCKKQFSQISKGFDNHITQNVPVVCRLIYSNINFRYCSTYLSFDSFVAECSLMDITPFGASYV